MSAPTSSALREAIDRSAEQSAEAMRRELARWTAGLTVTLLMPFLAYRLWTRDWLVLAVLAGIILTMAGAVLYLRRGGSGMVAVHVVIGTCGVGLVTASMAIGLWATVWLYPLVVAAFYCLPLPSALVVTGLSAASIIPAWAADPALGMRLAASAGLMLLLGWVFSSQLDRQRRDLARLALQDTLTGAGNRWALDEALAEHHYHKRRYGRPVTLVIIDLDRFKQINDRLGHQGGDRVLVDISAHLTNRLRRSDRVFRFGGEEFVVVLPETPLADAMQAAEDLRESCAELRVPGLGTLTFSGGAAELAEEETVEDWLRRADEALYRAKDQGRNRILEANRPG